MLSENEKQLLKDSTSKYLTIHQVRSYLEKSLESAKKAQSLADDNNIVLGYDFNTIVEYLELVTQSCWTNDIF